jgi:hypothetical protein
MRQLLTLGGIFTVAVLMAGFAFGLEGGGEVRASSPGLSVRRVVAFTSCDSCGQPANTPIPTTSPAPTSTPLPPAVLSEAAIAAIVNGIPGPAGSGLPNKVTVKLNAASIIPLFITEDVPPSNDFDFTFLPSAVKAAYGKQILVAVHAAFPALGMGTIYSSTELDFTIWSVKDWHIYPTFLLGTDFWDCTLNDDFTWFCPFPEFEVRLNLPRGTYEYTDVAWSRHEFWRPVP